MSQDCKCKKCREGCSNRAGWFLPDEIKKAAEYLELTEQEFFNKYLGVDWYESLNDIFVLAPAISSMEPGTEYPGNPIGKCIFFEDGLCKIHPVKPFECKEYYHTDTSKMVNDRHRDVARQWKDYQGYIIELLGDEPMAKELSLFGLWL